MAITTRNHTIRRLPDGTYSAWHLSTWWVGRYSTYRLADRALQLAQHWPDKYSGWYLSLDADIDAMDALTAERSPLFSEQPITPTRARETILPGDLVTLIGGCLPAMA